MSGSQKGERRGGRQKGTPNRTTIERRERAMKELVEQAAGVRASGKPIIIAKDELLDLIPIIKGTVAEFQKAAIGTNGDGLPNQSKFNREKWDDFRKWLELLEHTCHRAAEFQSPKYRAIAVTMPDPGAQRQEPKTINAAPVDAEGRERAANAAYLKLVKG